MAITTLLTIAALTVLLTVFAVFLGTHLHEYSHYCVGRFWTRDLTVKYVYLIFPISVEIEGIDEIPDWGIRVLAVAPQLILLPVLSYLYVRFGLPLSLLSFDLIHASLYAALLGGAFVTSPADWIAFLFPEAFRGMAEADRSYTHRANLRFLYRRISPF